MGAIWPVIIGAGITAIAGNFLVQRWQMRNWRDQQRQLGFKAEIDDLKKLIEEITNKCADRQNAMRRLLSSLAPESRIDLQEALSDYRHQLPLWNGALTSFYVRLRFTVDYSAAIRFEQDVHDYFRVTGEEIEAIVRARQAGHSANWSSLTRPKSMLNDIQGRSYSFLRDLNDVFEKRRDEIYFGKRLYYTIDNLREYSFFDLIKALFTSQVDGFYVVRAS